MRQSGAERDPADQGRSQRDPEPVDILVHALITGDVGLLEQVLAPDVVFTAPPLRVRSAGSQELAAALLGVAYGFDDFGYAVRSRYLSPGRSTDEATLSGVHTRDLLGLPPTGRPCTVAARVIVHHQEGLITELAVWPDVGAIRDLSENLAGVVDARAQGAAGQMVTALRATIPNGSAKVVVGQPREAPAAVATAAAQGRTDSDAGRSPGRTEGTKAPLPRAVRRRRAVLAGVAMLTASVGIVAWVATGVLSRGSTAVAAYPQASPGTVSTVDSGGGRAQGQPGRSGSSGTGGGSGAGKASPSASTPRATGKPVRIVQTNQGEGRATLGTDSLFFDTGKARLRPEFQAQLDELIRSAKNGGWIGTGVIVVDGYTDDVGTERDNLILSRDRAAAVAQALKRGLPQARIRAIGHGEKSAIGDNDTKAGRKQNRRVTVTFPAPRR